MKANLFVSVACLSIPPLIRRQSLPCSFIANSAPSRFQLPKSRIVRTQFTQSSFRSMATVGGNAESVALPAPVPVGVAHELLQAGHRYLDVRTPEEFSGGHAVGAINVPYMFKSGSGMTKNPNFLETTTTHFTKDAKIVVACQSGKRSQMAAKDLISAGFTGVTDVAGGYSAWTQSGLPIES